jgi:hypothetical protein
MKRVIRIIVLLVATFAITSLVAGPSFRELCKELVLASAGTSVVKGVDGWLFLKEELQHLGAGKFWGEDAVVASRTKKKAYADPMVAILEYNRLLAEKGITLYLMPVPGKALVYPDKLTETTDKAISAEDITLYRDFYGLLEKSGVKTINLLPTLLEKRDKVDVYCKTDSHFSGSGLMLFAEAAASVLGEQEWFNGVPKTDFQKTVRKVTIKGDLAQMIGDNELVEDLELSVVSRKSDGQPVATDPKSPVILLGDSHTLVFSVGGDLHGKGAGLFDHLSAELGFPVDLLGVRGSGVTPARINLFQRSKKDGNYLAGKKALVWCFSSRDFTGKGGWRKIPVAP